MLLLFVGDLLSPATIGINLPGTNWIRAHHDSKVCDYWQYYRCSYNKAACLMVLMKSLCIVIPGAETD